MLALQHLDSDLVEQPRVRERDLRSGGIRAHRSAQEADMVQQHPPGSERGEGSNLAVVTPTE